MPCITNENLTEVAKQKQRDALRKLSAKIAAGSVQVVVARGTGAFALKGWQDADREGVSDLCAYRALMNDPAMRMAVRKAQAMSNTPVSARAVATGLHSHDGGATWSRH
jgi:hypothetical protein